MMARWARLTLPPLSGTGVCGEFVVRWALLLVLGGMACLIAFVVVCLYVVRFGVTVRAAGVLEPGSTEMSTVLRRASSGQCGYGREIRWRRETCSPFSSSSL